MNNNDDGSRDIVLYIISEHQRDTFLADYIEAALENTEVEYYIDIDGAEAERKLQKVRVVPKMVFKSQRNFYLIFYRLLKSTTFY